MKPTFVETALFTARAKALLSDAELHALQLDLLANPDAGDLVAGTGGARKVRVAVGSRGKRGGVRVMYYHVRRAATVFLLFAYAKNEAGNLSVEGRKQLRKFVEILEQET